MPSIKRYDDGMMVRTQIQFTPEQAECLRKLAVEKQVSISELVRQGVDRMLASEAKPSREELIRRSLAIVGKFRSGKRAHSGRDHDKYLNSGSRW